MNRKLLDECLTMGNVQEKCFQNVFTEVKKKKRKEMRLICNRFFIVKINPNFINT